MNIYVFLTDCNKIASYYVPTAMHFATLCGDEVCSIFSNFNIMRRPGVNIIYNKNFRIAVIHGTRNSV